MRVVNIYRQIVVLLLACLLGVSHAFAFELDVQLEKTMWSYEEYAKDVTGFELQLPSLAESQGNLLKLRISSDRDADWFFALSYAQMLSTEKAEEVWGIFQTNALNIDQEDTRVDVQYRMLGARFGLWYAKRIQTQQRDTFYVNKVLTAVAGEPVPEVLTSTWAGLSLTSVGGNEGQFEARIDVAQPLDVLVTNPFFTKPFTKKDGLRAGVHFRWTLPKQAVGVSGLNVTLRQEYQELGGEQPSTGGFWPYNRWRMTSLGLLYAW